MSEQYAYIGTGRKTHRIKRRPGFGDLIARCGLEVFQGKYRRIVREDREPCLRCSPKKSNKWQVEEWDRWP